MTTQVSFDLEMQRQQSPPDPWADFFAVYLDLGYALHVEFSRDNSDDGNAKELAELLANIREGDPHSEWHRGVVHEVIKRFRGKSRDILFQDPAYFQEQLLLFPGIDGIDIAKVWRERPMYRTGLWQFVEQLFVIGNVCLHPNRKDKFLKVVRQLKQMKAGVDPSAQPEEEPEEDDIDGVVQGMAQMFGMSDNPAMGELMTDLAKHMHSTMSNASNPMALLQSMVSGDMSCLGDLQERMEQKIQDKMATGELTEEDFAQQREGMMQNFGGMEGLMQMAGGLGLQMPDAPEQGQNNAAEDPDKMFQMMETQGLIPADITAEQRAQIMQQIRNEVAPTGNPAEARRGQGARKKSKKKKKKKKSSRNKPK